MWYVGLSSTLEEWQRFGSCLVIRKRSDNSSENSIKIGNYEFVLKPVSKVGCPRPRDCVLQPDMWAGKVNWMTVVRLEENQSKVISCFLSAFSCVLYGFFSSPFVHHSETWKCSCVLKSLMKFIEHLRIECNFLCYLKNSGKYIYNKIYNLNQFKCTFQWHRGHLQCRPPITTMLQF